MGKHKSNWIQKQRADKYYKKSKSEGHRARSYYKLKHINDKYNIIKTHTKYPPKIIDLGAAPGAWLEYIRDVFQERWDNSIIKGIKVIGVDLNSIRPFSDVHYMVTERFDIFSEKFQKYIQDNGPYDAIISDLSPKTAGDDRDIIIQASMIRKLNEYLVNLKVGGSMVCKVFQSTESFGLFQMFLPRFAQLNRMKPSASRQSSREFYFVGTGFKG